MANLPTNIMDLRGFDSNIILILRVGILRSIGDFPESLSGKFESSNLSRHNASREIGRSGLFEIGLAACAGENLAPCVFDCGGFRYACASLFP